MKYFLKISLISVVLLFTACSCSHIIKLVGYQYGCWQEKEGEKPVCGFAETYNAKDSTYTMHTCDGWTTKIKASEIKWR